MSLLRKTPAVAFLLALATYWLTCDPGASYWDCPEYLVTAIRLEIGHAPGNPGWALAHRFASCFFTDPALQTRAVNMMSGLFSALAVGFLCSISMSVMRWIWPARGRGRRRMATIALASLCGSLSLAWSDSIWYSAVEAEVYAMSLFLSSLTVWMALKWAFSLSPAARARWIIALAYIIGFSVGVHQLNLLALPAIALIMLFRCRRRLRFMQVLLALLAGCLAVVAILKGLMPGSVALAGLADLFAVNTLGLPFWSGALAFWVLVIGIVVVAAVVVSRRRRVAGTALWSLAAVMVGYSVYILIPLRACANPPVNEGNPSDIFRFADYLDRRQYAKAPLLYGRTPFSETMRLEKVSVSPSGDTIRDYGSNAMSMQRRDWRPMMRGGKIPHRSRFLTDSDRNHNSRVASDTVPHGYVVAGFLTQPVTTPELDMWLPRIYAPGPDNLKAYGDWTGMDSASMVRVRISEAFDSLGRPVPLRAADGSTVGKFALRPTYMQSLSYLFGYQIGYMYLRYLMWNFAGRQNDVSSTGEIEHGNFITGLGPLDDLMLGDTSSLPPELGAGNPGRNRYWSVPFLIGIFGICLLFIGKGRGLVRLRMRRSAWVSLVLFLMTGVAIVVYLNQSPGEPRERDYSFLGSFWVFAFWISSGMLFILRMARSRVARVLLVCGVCAVPVWMLAENLDDHDRSGRSATLDFAENLLNSLDDDAILFVDGDNYIFPLWYAQEVMGVRRDVAVICSAYLGSDWYVTQLMTPRYGFDGLRMVADAPDIALGNFNLVRLPSAVSADTLDAVDALRELYADNSPIPSFRHRYLSFASRSVHPWIFDLAAIPGKPAGSLASLRELAAIDIIASNEASRYPRPVYWQQNVGKGKFYGFYPYTRQGLFTRRLMPSSPDSVVLTAEALDALPLLKWGGLDRSPYPGPDVTDEMRRQRSALLHLADVLRAEGRHDQALHVVRTAIVRFPAPLIPYSIRLHADSVYYEARRAAAILRESGTAMGDTAALRQAAAIMHDDSLRSVSFQRYRRSLPPGRRAALSTESRNLAIPNN